MKINDLVKEAYDNAIEKGWHETPRSSLEVHMLIVSEIAEATEAVRDGMPPAYQINKDGEVAELYNSLERGKWNSELKPEGEMIELADAVIRIMDYFGERGWDLEAALKIKMIYNESRDYRHGGKKA